MLKMAARQHGKKKNPKGMTHANSQESDFPAEDEDHENTVRNTRVKNLQQCCMLHIWPHRAQIARDTTPPKSGGRPFRVWAAKCMLQTEGQTLLNSDQDHIAERLFVFIASLRVGSHPGNTSEDMRIPAAKVEVDRV